MDVSVELPMGVGAGAPAAAFEPAEAAGPTAAPPAAPASATASVGAPAPVRGYSASKDQLLKRLRRIEGQVRGVQNMVVDDRYCIDVLTQISAIQAALDKVALGLLDGHAHHCVMGAAEGERDAKTDEMMAAVGRLMHRG
jgi:DNA-binding FrmR family transcriptional regulator